MPPAEATAFRCRATPRDRAMLYHALAHALASARRPAGAVFEAVAPDPVPRVTVRPARLVDD
ncbi:MAG: hypothetical protein WA719_00680, partial [Thermoplasmata archaeon]